MVNASLNWASIVGIALSVCGAGLYFMRSFKPALARDYDVFFAAIGLLCGGILFFQGWRLDPILQFGQFLLAGTTVFFAYESVRLRGLAADQARRSSYFDDDQPSSRMPSGGTRRGWEDTYDQFEEPQPLSRRFSGQEDFDGDRSEEDFYRPRRTSRAAIPEQAASRRRRTRDEGDSWGSGSGTESRRRMARFGQIDDATETRSSFGERRNIRQEQRRGSRPSRNQQASTRNKPLEQNSLINRTKRDGGYSVSGRQINRPQGTPIRPEAEDASFTPSVRPKRSFQNEPFQAGKGLDTQKSQQGSSYSQGSDTAFQKNTSRTPKQRDNNSRFDN